MGKITYKLSKCELETMIDMIDNLSGSHDVLCDVVTSLVKQNDLQIELLKELKEILEKIV
jgi:hypothetical protein